MWPKTVWIVYRNERGEERARAEMNLVHIEPGRELTVSTRTLGEEIQLIWDGRVYRTNILGCDVTCDRVYPK